MTRPDPTTARNRLVAAGVDPSDLSWLESLGFDDSAVPPIETAAQAATYEQRAARLSALAGRLSLWERETALESRLAASLGARVADWKDQQSGEEDE